MSKKPKILVAGATGFIGRRLVAALTAAGYPLRCVARRPGTLPAENKVLAGDIADPAFLEAALSEIDTAYYLVHSLNAGARRFAERDREAAKNFVAAGESCGLRRVIYLSGLGEGQQMSNLSEHLQSRHEVGRILGEGAFAATVLRAAIIVGAGSVSFEILRFLVQTQFVLPDVDALDTKCQPIAVDNVIDYLLGCLQEEKTCGETFDIGGPEVLTYRSMLDQLAEAAGTVNLYVPAPSSFARLAARMIGTVSTINRNVALALLKGMQHEVVCQEKRIRAIIPLELAPYAEAVKAALREREIVAAVKTG